MWTKKAVIVLSLGIILSLFALVFRSLQLAIASVMILSYVFVSMLFLSLGRVMPLRKLSSERVFEDSHVDVSLELVNRGKRTGFLEVRDKLPSALEIKQGSNYLIIDLRAGEKTRVDYQIFTPLRGVYDIGPVSFRATDNFGLFYKELEVKDVANLVVFPQITEVKEIFMRSRSRKLFPGGSPVKQPGPGSEFFLIREYVPGDPFKDINWKAYASKRKLLVNEHEREAVRDVILIVDARVSTGYGTLGENALMHSCRAAATAANHFLKRRDNIGLLAFGERTVSLKPGCGSKHLYELLTALAGLVPEGNLPMEGLVDFAAPTLSKSSPIIIFSPLTDDPTIVKGISKLRVLGFPVLIISPSSVEFEVNARMKTRQGIKDLLPYDVLRLEREVIMNDVTGYGANVINWDPKTPLLGVLAETKSMAY